MTIQKRLALGFSSIVLVFAGSTIFTQLETRQAMELSGRVLELRAPTVTESTRLQVGVERSLASLRGYMLLEKPEFKTVRKEAWEELIDPALTELETLSVHWTNSANVSRLEEVRSSLKELKSAQERIEQVTGTNENIPALALLSGEASAKVDSMFSLVSQLIDIESKRSSSGERVPLLHALADVRGTLGLSFAKLREYVLTGDAAAKSSFEGLWRKNTLRFGAVAEFEGILSSEETALWAELKSARESFEAFPARIFALREAADWNRANFMLAERAAPVAAGIMRNIDAMVQDQRRLSASDINAARSASAQLELVQMVLLVATILLAIGVSVWNGRSISTALRRMADSLLSGASQTAVAAELVSATGQSLASGASEQAASLEEISASLEELTSTTQRNTQGAKRVKAIAVDARREAEAGSEDVSRMSVAMGEIKTAGDNIASIVKTIDEIAFQTNILALNAAVEAARAGNAGSGFSVVAEEVRNLAQRSARAAKETAEKIDDSIEKSERGVQLSGLVAGRLSGIVGKVREVDQFVDEIVCASEEQAVGFCQIKKAMAQMDQVSQSNAVAAEEGASSAEELHGQAESLQETVEELLQLVDKRSHGEWPSGDRAATPTRRERSPVRGAVVEFDEWGVDDRKGDAPSGVAGLGESADGFQRAVGIDW